MKIPTLHSGTLQILESVEDKISYIIRHSLTNPGFTSDLIEDQLLSFRKLEALHDGRVEELVEDYRITLEDAIVRVLDLRVEVIIDIVQLDMTNKDNKLFNPNLDDPVANPSTHDDKYSLTVTVVDSETSLPIITYGKITVDGADIKIQFDSTGEPV